MSETELLIKEYAKNPLCNYEMKDFDISRHEGNFICGDDITVYLKIKDKKISEFSDEERNLTELVRVALLIFCVVVYFIARAFV